MRHGRAFTRQGKSWSPVSNPANQLECNWVPSSKEWCTFSFDTHTLLLWEKSDPNFFSPQVPIHLHHVILNAFMFNQCSFIIFKQSDTSDVMLWTIFPWMTWHPSEGNNNIPSEPQRRKEPEEVLFLPTCFVSVGLAETTRSWGFDMVVTASYPREIMNQSSDIFS